MIFCWGRIPGDINTRTTKSYNFPISFTKFSRLVMSRMGSATNDFIETMNAPMWIISQSEWNMSLTLSSVIVGTRYIHDYLIIGI